MAKAPTGEPVGAFVRGRMRAVPQCPYRAVPKSWVQ